MFDDECNHYKMLVTISDDYLKRLSEKYSGKKCMVGSDGSTFVIEDIIEIDNELVLRVKKSSTCSLLLSISNIKMVE